MTLAAKKPQPLFGREKPRLAPPTPARSQVETLIAMAAKLGLELMPWQRVVARYLYGLGPGEQWLYPEVALIVARQNGKSTVFRPHVMERLRRGRRVLHAAQKRDLARKMFVRYIVPAVRVQYPDAYIRQAGGQELIELPNGGAYSIAAATGGGSRGESVDDLLLDELRELDEEFVEAAKGTLAASLNPQTVYLSNAGAEDSFALNALRMRGQEDPSLAWLEWSAGPDRSVMDVEGWAEANPSMGHFPNQFAFLERTYRSHSLAGTLAHFETEHLCRWVTTTRERLVDDSDWILCKGDMRAPVRPSLAVSLDPDGTRASIALAWATGPRAVSLRLIHHATGSPVDTDELREEVKRLRLKYKATVGYDPLTDAALVKGLQKTQAKSISGQEFANASQQFAFAVAGQWLTWSDADMVTDDLTWTARKPDGVDGSFHAVRAKDDHPITASLAAIRAVWLASGPRPATPRIY